MLSIYRGIIAKFTPTVSVLNKLCSNQSQFHTNATLLDKEKRFLSHNDKIYPPQTADETPRPAVSFYFIYFSCLKRIYLSIFDFYSLAVVYLLSKRKSQIQSRQIVVCCMYGAWNDHWWGNTSNAICFKERSSICSWRTVGSPRIGRQTAQCWIQK